MSAVAEQRRVSHYRIGEKLGTGGMGTVYRAVDEALGRTVALKFLKPSIAADAEASRRFIQEARAASSLDHPNICTIYEAGTTESGEIFIVMPCYEGETLDRIVARGPLSCERAVSLAMQIGRGLAAAHDELIVHRDIKPQNVIVTRGDTVKILDFGLAKLAGAPRSAPGLVIGTPEYMAPEQLRGDPVDQRADIWSLGVLLYESLAGRSPFRAESIEATWRAILDTEPRPLHEVRSDIPSAIDAILVRALAKDRNRRYSRVEEMISDLSRLTSDSDPAAITASHRAAVPKTSIAVLPFADMSPNKDQEHLCDGIAEEILRALGRIEGLHVVSRTSAFQYKGRAADIHDIGARLNVGYVLEGSVRRAGDRVRITAQLIDVADGYRLWYDRFERDLTDIFAVEDEIAEKIATSLRLELSAGPQRTMSPVQLESYEIYLQGRQFFHHHRRKSLEIAMQSFERAIAVDPENARAYAGIADCNAFLRLYFGAGEDTIRAADAASRHALAIDPDLAEAHVSRGLALYLSEDAPAAERELSRAIELDPRLYEAHYIAGRVAFSQGRIAEAARHFRDACVLVPESFDSFYLLDMCYRRLGDAPRAHAARLSCAEAVQKRLRQHPDDTRAWTMGAAVSAELGEPYRATQWVKQALAIDRDEPIIAYNAACVYVTLGRHDEAIACLQDSVGRASLSRAWAANDPDLDPLRADPRFIALMQESGVVSAG